MTTKRKANRTLISVPLELKERLERIAASMLTAYENGQTDRPQLTEQGSKGSWVPLSEVIRIACDELESHQERSRHKPARQTKQLVTV